MMSEDSVAHLLSDKGAQVIPIEGKEKWALQERWRALFGIGRAPPGNLDWHVFSHDLRSHLSGFKAEQAFSESSLDEVLAVWVGPVDDLRGYRVLGALPEPRHLRGLASRTGGDLYLMSSDFSWTVVWPHENAMGPYFARADES
jgi:hypothetical protein